MGHRRPLFRLFSSFKTDITIFITNVCEKMSIQYLVLGFEPTTFRTKQPYKRRNIRYLGSLKYMRKAYAPIGRS